MIARPLDARHPGEMVNVALIRHPGFPDFTFSYRDYEAYRDSVHSFSGLIAMSIEQMTLSNAGGIVSQRTSASESRLGRLGLLSSGASNAEFAGVVVVSENYFQVLGVPAVGGRTFESLSFADLTTSPSVLISENYWQRRFARDPGILGKTIDLNGAAFGIIGITPHNFVGTNVGVPDFWLPLSLAPLAHTGDKRLTDREILCCRLFARLARGAGIRQAQAETTLVADRLRTLHDPRSESAKPVTALVWPGSPFPAPLKSYGGLKLAILLIMAAAGMVLVVACANVGSLQLARARARQSELHTRLSLGASRRRVIRQLLTESALLGLLAGAAAFLFSWALLKVSVTMVADAMPPEYGSFFFDVTPDLEVFAYVFAVSQIAGILFGLVPAMESSRAALVSAVRGSASAVRSRRFQGFLVAAQVALSLVLLIAGSTLIRGSIQSLRTDPGYDSKHLIDLDVQFPEASKYTAGRKTALVDELRTRLATLPGVAAVTSAQPPAGLGLRTPVSLNGENPSADNMQAILHYTRVPANYFRTLRIPLLFGRSFQTQAGQPEQSAVVSESAAQQLWPGQNPIGRSLRLGVTDEKAHNRSEFFSTGGPAYQVVGVARDTRGVEFDGSDSKQIYLPLPEDQLAGHPILIRTGSNPAQIVGAIDPILSSVDPGLIANVSTIEEMLRWSPTVTVASLAAAVASAVGLAGLLLASMGIYGTVRYIVVLRTREVGIRMAVGAQKRDILGLILREITWPVAAGLVAGMLLAGGAGYLVRGLLYGVNTVDGVSLAGVSFLFLAIALFAAYPPSRRAIRVDPTVALRYE
jgi:predicted permease